MRKKIDPSKKPLPWLKKQCDKIWSILVRQRDGGKCVLCGKRSKRNAAHHWIVCKSGGNNTRWNVDNGITLCYGHHIRVVHKNADYSTIMNLRSKCKLNDSDIEFVRMDASTKPASNKQLKKNLADWYTKHAAVLKGSK